MARIVYEDRIEVFAFAETGLGAALTEAARFITAIENRDVVDPKIARLEYRDGTHYVVLPYNLEDEEDRLDTPDVEYRAS